MIALSAGPDRVSADTVGRRTRVGIGVLLLVACASGLAGAGIARYTIMRRLGPLSALMVSGPRTPADAPRIAAHLARDLDLTAEQKQQVESILSRRLVEIGAYRDQVSAELFSMIVATQADLDSVLTPTQRVKFLAMRRRRGLVDSAGRPIAGPLPLRR